MKELLVTKAEQPDYIPIFPSGLTITIAGRPCSGKTRLARFLGAVFSIQCHRVKLVDERDKPMHLPKPECCPPLDIPRNVTIRAASIGSPLPVPEMPAPGAPSR